MSTALVHTPPSVDPALVERVVIHGDLRQLSPAQKVSYYNAVCQSVGLNPLTRPFEYIVLNGKEVLYAKRDATDQLRMVHSVSVQIIAREVAEDCYVVTARASLPSGRCDESLGAVPIASLKGETRANAMMKCETKAKRRVTLSICGLGMLDETEVASIPGAVVPLQGHREEPVKPSASNGGGIEALPIPANVNPETGEERPTPPLGFHYVQDYTFRAGWHEATLLAYDAQGGWLRVSTKRAFGQLLQQAEIDGVPVQVSVKHKANGRGEAYLEAIQTYKAEREPHPDDDAPMLDVDSIPF